MSDLAAVIALYREEVAYSIEQCDQHTMVDNRHLTAILDAAEAGMRARSRLFDVSVMLRSVAQNDHMVDNHFTETGKVINDAANAVLMAFDDVPCTIYAGRVAVDRASQEIAKQVRNAALDEAVNAAMTTAGAFCSAEDYSVGYRNGCEDSAISIRALKDEPKTTKKSRR